MSSELYLDLVSKTIISMLSKEIAVDVGSQVGARVNELLNNTLGGLIAGQLSAQTERLGRSIMELEGALKPQIGQLGERITAISEQIIEKLGEKSGLSDEIEAVKASISSSMDQLSRQITTISEATAAIAEKANQDSMRQAMDLLAAHVQQAQAASSAMKRDFSAALSAIGDALQKTLDAQGTKIEGVSTKIDEAFDSMDKRISTVVESTAKLAGQTNIDMLQQVLHGLQRQEEDNSNASNAIKSDLSAIKDTLHIVGQMDGISTKIEEAIKQSLQTGSKEDGEMLKGVYYSMKKLVSEFNKEKEDAILFNKQYLNSMSDLKGHIEEDFGKRLAEAIEQNAGLQDAIQTINRTLQHSVKDQNRLLLDIVGTIEKQLPFFSGKVEDSISAIAEKITAYERATLSKLTNTGADVMRFISENVINDIKDMGKRHHTLMAEVGQIKQLSSGGAKDQVDVLQGVFLSVKKLLNIATKERDTNEKVANQLTNALDNLYSQIRRLESEKDELDVELLRLAGDDYFKNKFKQLENDLHKARSLADKYQEEKMELEQKYMRLQQQWDLAQELEGR